MDGSEEERMDNLRLAAEHELRLVLRRVKRELDVYKRQVHICTLKTKTGGRHLWRKRDTFIG